MKGRRQMAAAASAATPPAGQHMPEGQTSWYRLTAEAIAHQLDVDPAHVAIRVLACAVPAAHVARAVAHGGATGSTAAEGEEHEEVFEVAAPAEGPLEELRQLGERLARRYPWAEAEAVRLPWRAPIASLNILLTSTCWRNDHNGFSHQGPGLIDVMLSKRGTVARIYLPPDANCLLSVADHCLRSRNYVNLIVIDKQPQLQYFTPDQAIEHCRRGASILPRASSDDGGEPDVVLGAAGDIPMLETVAAAWWLRQLVPDLRVRVVNVVDLMRLFPATYHPHGMTTEEFIELFTADKPVVFAFHGYQQAIHEIVHGHPDVDRIHVRGFNEQGTTTAPFQMVVFNSMSRFHLAAEAIRRVPRLSARMPGLLADCEARIAQSVAYAQEHFEDPPEIRDWVWTD